MKKKGFRLFYAAGPVDAVATFRLWLRGESEPQQLALTYSEQFFNLTRRLGADGRVISSCYRADHENAGGIEVLNRPRRPWGASLWLAQLFYGFGIVVDILRWRPDVAIIAEGTCPWFLFWIPRIAGVKVVPSIHCVVWPPVRKPGRLQMCWLRLEGLVFRWAFDATLCGSEMAGRQIEWMAGGSPRLRYFLPTYRLTLFSETMVPCGMEDASRLFFAGNLEVENGIFDLLQAFELLEQQSPGRYTLDLCGSGGGAEALQTEINQRGLGRRVILRGHCSAEVLRRYLAACHVVVAPTTSRFVEGFNQAIAEGVLAGRPVVATNVCPSAHLFAGAVKMIEPDSPRELALAIRSIAEDRAVYARMHEASFAHRRDLFSFQHSWEKTLSGVISDMIPSGKGDGSISMGYLVPQFPSQTHAFFWRELCALRDLGANVTLLSTRAPVLDACSHAFAAEAQKQTIYLDRVGVTDILFLIARGWRTWRSFEYILTLSESTWREKLRLLFLIPCAARLTRVARQLGLQHLHIHSCADASHLGALAKRLDDLAYSATLHGDLPVYGKDHKHKFKDAAWVSAVTHPLREQIISQTGYDAAKVPVIWMGVDTGRFLGKTDRAASGGSIQVVTVARLIAQKGHHDALQAIALLRGRGIDVRYVIAGAGPCESEIRAEIARLGLEHVVTLAGNLSEDAVRSLLEASDAFVLPSYGLGEAAPVSVMEAMACGLPVIATRIGGTPDMISHMEDGWLVPQRDVEQLALALGTIAKDAELRARLGRAARAKAVTMFDHKVNAAKLFDWIRGTQPEVVRPTQTSSGKILLIMEQCNPLWPSVPRVAFEIYRHLQGITGVTLVTHARNRAGLYGWMPDADIHFIEESPSVRGYYHLISKLVGGRGTNWPLLHALGYPVYAEFDRQVADQFGERVRAGEFRAVVATTPILPRYPYSIAKACDTVPFILGPVNGGLPFPKGFGKIASQEHAGFNFLRQIGRLLPGYEETYRRADRILAGSEYTLGWLRKTFPESSSRMIWMPENGLSRRFYLQKPLRGESTGPLNLLFAGRLVPYKGADILLEAMAMAQGRIKRQLRLRIVGDGPMRKALEKQAVKLGLQNAVSFSGLVTPEQMPVEFQAADLFCFPSIREFGGAVVLEAMAAGTPCVVVDHGGIGEYVTEASGVKVKPESRTYLIVRFADALVRAAVDEDWLRSMGCEARSRAEEFSWEAKVRQLEAIVAEAIAERSGPKRKAA